MARWGRAWRVAAVLLMPAAATGLLLRPPAPLRLAPHRDQPRLWQGAFHVHSSRSDGSGSAETIAAAARRAGLHFVVLTDHGDATRRPDPPRYLDDVLMIDGVEISTDDGHYVAVGMPAAPYPLAGEGRAVAEDVRRLGGIGVLAHPESPRPALAWRDWSVPADGFEWVNGDSTWRGATTPQFLTRLFTYPLRAAGSLAALATYPGGLLARLDTPDRPPQLALAAVDAHARLGWRRNADPQENGHTLARFPSYAASFGTFGLVVPWYDGAPSGDAGRDAHALVAAIRLRVAYSSVFSMAAPTWLTLDLLEPIDQAVPGPDARGVATLVVDSNLPPAVTYRILRNGRSWKTLRPGDRSVRLDAAAAPALYRAEAWLPHRRGWPPLPVAISAARAHNVVAPGAAPRQTRGTGSPDRAAPSSVVAAINGWHAEHDPRSDGTVRVATSAPRVEAVLTLASGPRASQFAALVADLGAPPDGTTGLDLQLSADAPMRISIQLREPRPGEGLRWRHSAFVDSTPRRVLLPTDAFRPIAPASGAPVLGRLHALLLVMDTVNARPGDRRRLTVHEVRWTTGR